MISVVRDSAEKAIPVVYTRNGQTKETTVTPAKDKAPTPVMNSELMITEEMRIQGKIQVQFVQIKQNLPLTSAISEAVSFPVMAGKKFFVMFTQPKELTQSLSGPMGIAKATSDASSSWDKIVGLAALLSISVGFLNLLPVPPLDGGQMAVALAEMLRRGKRLSIKTQFIVNLTGMGLLAVLVFSAIFGDLKRLQAGPATKPAASTPQK